MKNRVIPFILIFLVFGCARQGNDNNRKITDVSMSIEKRPVLIGKPSSELLYLKISAGNVSGKPVSITKAEINFTSESNPECLSAIIIHQKPGGSGPSTPLLFGNKEAPSFKNKISGRNILVDGDNFLMVSFVPSEIIDLTAKLEIKSVKLHLSNLTIRDIPVPESSDPWRFGLVLRATGQDSCNTYRIPGLVTTNNGTLIAVYDNRYRSSRDLQGDIDIGMSRSTDGGSSWEPMKVIMDMGEYGGRPQELNGIGDPCILYDNKTNTIWVAALWMSGASTDQMLWWASKPGMEPDVTGQFIIVKSTDDGVTWSEPINITSQIKDPSWQLLLQGPGRGLTMKDGTLVFPAQFKADIGTTAIDGGQYTCHSTIVYSNDQGVTWHIGSGAKSNTTEAQAVELSDGSLMLNMRDDRNRKDKTDTNGRAVAITTDLGQTWTTHPSSNSALPEPNCMASLISADINFQGEKKKVLFFSNPNSTTSRANMTIKASLDEGLTWPEEYQIELNAPECFGYSCLTMIDKNSLGILYEGVRELYFQKIQVADILGMKTK